MEPKVVIGAATEAVTQKLVVGVRSLPSNKVAKLDSTLLGDVLPFLPPSLQETEALYGLRLAAKTKQNMAYSGWLYSRYLDACCKSKIDPAITVTLYSDGLFREFGQFGVLGLEGFFLGFGQGGAEMLKVILRAESQFDPNDFDADGYRK